VVFTKADLAPAENAAERLGTPRAHTISSRDGCGLKDYRRALGGQSPTVLCGPSGVGKSSLLNALAPDSR